MWPIFKSLQSRMSRETKLVTFSEESWEVLREHLVRLAEGQTSFASETMIQDLAGQRRIVLARWSVLQGSREVT